MSPATNSAVASSSNHLGKHKSEDTTVSTTDHRKRRRNRTTQSCLNCHGSKRMCDRKRPACGRCVKLGLSGICVYEVDDLNQRDEQKDETTLLKDRIAELEGFIRECKKKPHPRWTDDLGRTRTSPTSETCELSADIDTRATSPASKRAWDTPSPILSDAGTSTTSSSSSMPVTPANHDNSPILLSPPSNIPIFLSMGSDAPVPPLASGPYVSVMQKRVEENLISSSLSLGDLGLTGTGDSTLEHVFAQILRGDAARSGALVTSSTPPPCQCVKKSSVYSVVLELAPHVRRALDALGALPDHQARQDSAGCGYYRRLQSLDNATAAIVKTVSSSLTSPTAAPECSPKASRSLPNSDTAPCFPPEELFRGSLGELGFPFPLVGGPQLPESRVPQAWAGIRSADEHQLTDRFMTWNPPATKTTRLEWPRTIQL